MCAVTLLGILAALTVLLDFVASMVVHHPRRFRRRIRDEEVHCYINERASSVDTYLYGRRMYEAMVC